MQSLSSLRNISVRRDKIKVLGNSMSEFSGPVDRVEELTAPTPDDIKSQLTRIFSAEGFSNSPRLKDLLSFLVEQKLRNNTEYLKEYSIGVEVFGRSSNFDPRTDTIVRRTA